MICYDLRWCGRNQSWWIYVTLVDSCDCFYHVCNRLKHKDCWHGRRCGFSILKLKAMLVIILSISFHWYFWQSSYVYRDTDKTTLHNCESCFFLHEELENVFAQNPSPKRTQYLNFNVCYSFIINRVDYKPINMSNFTGMDLASRNF